MRERQERGFDHDYDHDQDHDGAGGANWELGGETTKGTSASAEGLRRDRKDAKERREAERGFDHDYDHDHDHDSAGGAGGAGVEQG